MDGVLLDVTLLQIRHIFSRNEGTCSEVYIYINIPDLFASILALNCRNQPKNGKGVYFIVSSLFFPFQVDKQ